MRVPYAMVAAVDNYRRHAQMAIALQNNYERLQQLPMDDSKSLTLACYGPSLADTYQTMTRPIMSMSGATKWLAERGIIPDYHVDMDPRPNKVDDLTPIVPGVHYIMASVCHPNVWKCLVGQRVTMWHVYSSEYTEPFIGAMDNGGVLIRGGSTIGLTALHIGGVLGFRHFEIHGMDGSFKDLERTTRHAGPHTGHKQNKDGITWNVFNKTYATSKIMANAVQETLNQVASFPMFCVFHGEGLTQALIRKKNFKNACCADELEKAAIIRKAQARVYELKPNMAEWDQLCAPVTPESVEELTKIREANEERRKYANYNTGSVTLEQMLQLRGICLKHKPKTVVEVGTFIGNSTMAMEAEEIYTCDSSNDCFPATDKIHTFPRKNSTDMLGWLVEKNKKADMFFFDGRIQPQDLPLIMRLSHNKTIYAFDDYTGNQKGIVNAQLLSGILPTWRLIGPDARFAQKSTLAVMAPQELFAA